MNERLRRAFSALGRGVRDAWLIAGLTLGLFLALEGAYRLQLAAKRALRPQRQPQWAAPEHPYHGQAWYPEFGAAMRLRSYRLDPYRGYWLKPLASPWVNIDSTGRRVVAQPPLPAGAPFVLLFGGSAAWGLSARDSFTIASQLVPALARRGVTGVAIVSDAQPGFNSTQEAATLQIELATGARPAAIVLMNGYNDAASGIITGRAGVTYSEGDAQKLLDRGRRRFWGQLVGLAGHSELVQRLRQVVIPVERRSILADTVCPKVAAWYASVERSVLAMAADRGIPALIFLQPHHMTTRKAPSAWEAQLPRDERVPACIDAIAAAMAPYAGTRFFDLRGLFDADTGTAFVDFHSHVTEAANGRIADAIAERLAPLLLPAAPGGRR